MYTLHVNYVLANYVHTAIAKYVGTARWLGKRILSYLVDVARPIEKLHAYDYTYIRSFIHSIQL